MRYIIPRERDGSLSTTMVELHGDDGSVRSIPLAEGNADAEAFQQWKDDGGVPESAPEASSPVPASISRRQFAMACTTLGLMTQTEALAFVTTNAIPSILDAAINSLPANQRFAMQMAVAGSMFFERENPATAALMQAAGRSPADADAIWRLGATFP